jgi:hypothetical protein
VTSGSAAVPQGIGTYCSRVETGEVAKHTRVTPRSTLDRVQDWRRMPRPPAWRSLYASNVLLLLIIISAGIASVRDVITGHMGWWTAVELLVLVATAAYLIMWLRRPVYPHERG